MSVLLYGPHGDPLIEQADPIADMSMDFDPSAALPGAACSGCGCTDQSGCPPYGCFWVAPGLCSSCAPDLAERWTALET
jgi:hypothetical protein